MKRGVRETIAVSAALLAALFILHTLISFITFKSDKARSVISGRPAVIMRDGVIDRTEMKRLCLTLSDLLEGLRSAGFLDPAEVGTAVVEANGTISAFEAMASAWAAVSYFVLPPRMRYPSCDQSTLKEGN